MITAKEIKADIRKAIKLFGEYNFYDKGLYEIMDTNKYKTLFVAIGAKETADVLETVIDLDKKYGQRFVEQMISDLDDQPEEFFNMLMARKKLARLY